VEARKGDFEGKDKRPKDHRKIPERKKEKKKSHYKPES